MGAISDGTERRPSSLTVWRGLNGQSTTASPRACAARLRPAVQVCGWTNRFRAKRHQNLEMDSRLLDPVHEWDHARGAEEAPFTVVEYGDYECLDCGRLFGILRNLEGQLSGRLRLVYRHYPL